MMVTLTVESSTITTNHECNMPNDFNNCDTITRAEARRQWLDSMFKLLALNRLGRSREDAINYVTIPSSMGK